MGTGCEGRNSISQTHRLAPRANYHIPDIDKRVNWLWIHKHRQNQQPLNHQINISIINSKAHRHESESGFPFTGCLSLVQASPARVEHSRSLHTRWIKTRPAQKLLVRVKFAGNPYSYRTRINVNHRHWNTCRLVFLGTRIRLLGLALVSAWT